MKDGYFYDYSHLHDITYWGKKTVKYAESNYVDKASSPIDVKIANNFSPLVSDWILGKIILFHYIFPGIVLESMYVCLCKKDFYAYVT